MDLRSFRPHRLYCDPKDTACPEPPHRGDGPHTDSQFTWGGYSTTMRSMMRDPFDILHMDISSAIIDTLAIRTHGTTEHWRSRGRAAEQGLPAVPWVAWLDHWLPPIWQLSVDDDWLKGYRKGAAALIIITCNMRPFLFRREDMEQVPLYRHVFELRPGEAQCGPVSLLDQMRTSPKAKGVCPPTGCTFADHSMYPSSHRQHHRGHQSDRRTYRQSMDIRSTAAPKPGNRGATREEGA